MSLISIWGDIGLLVFLFLMVLIGYSLSRSLGILEIYVRRLLAGFCCCSSNGNQRNIFKQILGDFWPYNNEWLWDQKWAAEQLAQVKTCGVFFVFWVFLLYLWLKSPVFKADADSVESNLAPASTQLKRECNWEGNQCSLAGCHICSVRHVSPHKHLF